MSGSHLHISQCMPWQQHPDHFQLPAVQLTQRRLNGSGISVQRTGTGATDEDGDTDGSSLVPSTSQNSFANGASGTETEHSGNETGGPRGPGTMADTSAESGNEAGAFDTSAISKKLAKRPPMAKVSLP